MDESNQTPLSTGPPLPADTNASSDVHQSPSPPASPMAPTTPAPAPASVASSSFVDIKPKKGKIAKPIILSLLVILLVGGGLWSVTKYLRERQNIQGEATGSDVRLSLVASPQSVAVGQTFTVVVYIDPTKSNYHISTTEVPVTYPSTVISLQAIEVGNFFGQYHTVGQTEMLNKNNATTPGIAKVILGSPCTASPPWICYPQLSSIATVGELARLTFLAAASGTASIGFDVPNVKISAREFVEPGNSVNVVDSANLVSITVQVTGATPTLIPTLPSVPTNTPGITPFQTVTPTKTPKPTRTPTSRSLR